MPSLSVTGIYFSAGTRDVVGGEGVGRGYSEFCIL